MFSKQLGQGCNTSPAAGPNIIGLILNGGCFYHCTHSAIVRDSRIDQVKVIFVPAIKPINPCGAEIVGVVSHSAQPLRVPPECKIPSNQLTH